WTRREALGMLGIGVAAAALPDIATAAPTLPRGAVIRTILKDYTPEELGGGATLFHEHMSFAPDFMPRWTKFSAETRAANGLPVPAAPAGRGAAPPPPPSTNTAGVFFMQDLDLMSEEMTIARQEGISCIVDGGHADMGRDLAFLRELSRKSGMP